jgi:hypothetical protein
MLVKCIDFGQWGCRPGRIINVDDDRAALLIKSKQAIAIAKVAKAPKASAQAIVVADHAHVVEVVETPEIAAAMNEEPEAVNAEEQSLTAISLA